LDDELAATARCSTAIRSKHRPAHPAHDDWIVSFSQPSAVALVDA